MDLGKQNYVSLVRIKFDLLKLLINELCMVQTAIMYNSTVTLTFGDQAENHVGMQKIGTAATEGFTVKDLEEIQSSMPCVTSELINLNMVGPDDASQARVLIFRDLLSRDEADRMYDEQIALEWDTKAYMYGRVVNKRARYNLCYADTGQDPDYERKKGRIVPYSEVPELTRFKNELVCMFGEKATGLVCEGNHYYDPDKCGIGYHGDSERFKVIGVRLGRTVPLVYRWYHKKQRVSDPITIELNHGDVYIMSEKAVGRDWKKSSIYTLRHAAGCDKYTK